MMLREARVVVGLATTTGVCQSAYDAHGLASTACIALGRLLTAAALTGLIQRGRNLTSLQLVGAGQLGQLFADVTGDGHLRGYVKNPHIAMPPLPGEGPRTRRLLGHALRPGRSSLIRDPEGQSFEQSSADLVSGEVDEDIEHLVTQSDQVPTTLVCDVLLGEDARVVAAGGVLVQAMPDSKPEALAAALAAVKQGAFARALAAHGGDDEALRAALFPSAEDVEPTRPLVWQCRCSIERVLTALKMLEVADLADMVATGEAAAVRCDFCNTRYEVKAEQIKRVYEMVKGPVN